MTITLNGASHSATDHDVVVVGAGFSGLYLVHSLTKLGFNVRAFEAAEGPGGTWYWNRYPGARCDSESLTYCYLFDDNLKQEWEWSDRYPAGPEVLRYLNHVADRFHLRKYFSFNTAVTTATYDERGRKWTLTTDKGESVTSRFFVSAVGNLSVPNRPEVPGIDEYEGRWLHTGRWPKEPVDLAGKRVAVIGTGSSGIQVAQEIAKVAGHLTVFQRTPTYTIPLRNIPLDPHYQKLWKQSYKQYTEITRYSGGGLPFDSGSKKLKDADPEQAQRDLEKLWNLGGFRFMFGIYDDISSDPVSNKIAADFIRAKIDATVKDTETAALLKPGSYPLGAKRIPLMTNYYEIYNQPNVKLVSLLTSPVSRMTKKGLMAGDKEYEFDIVVFATGFEAVTGPMLKVAVKGREGRQLKDVWADGPYSFLGLATPGFPNLLTCAGPGGPGLISNVPPTLEQHVEWIRDCIEFMRDHQIDEIEAQDEAAKEWIGHVHKISHKTMYPQAPRSWYDGSSITGKVRPFPIYTGGFGPYRRICDKLAADNYWGFRLHHEGAGGADPEREVPSEQWYDEYVKQSA